MSRYRGVLVTRYAIESNDTFRLSSSVFRECRERQDDLTLPVLGSRICVGKMLLPQHLVLNEDFGSNTGWFHKSLLVFKASYLDFTILNTLQCCLLCDETIHFPYERIRQHPGLPLWSSVIHLVSLLKMAMIDST